MTVSLALLVVMVVLYAAGVYLLLDRSLTRVLLGFLLVGNATNLLIFLTSGSFGRAPIVGEAEPAEMSDPLPQAMVLTAIVITLSVAASVVAERSSAYAVAATEYVPHGSDFVPIVAVPASPVVELTGTVLVTVPPPTVTVPANGISRPVSSIADTVAMLVRALEPVQV